MIALALALAFAAPGAEVAFVRASAQLDGESQAYLAVDGDPSTAWCTKTRHDGTGAALLFGFLQPVTVSQVGIVLGERPARRPRRALFSDAKRKVELFFRDIDAPQVVQLSPPARGKRLFLDVTEAFDGAKPGARLCIAEVVLKDRGVELTGARVAARYRTLNEPERRLLLEWLDDASAPERSLLFAMDGTFRYRYTPLLGGKKVELRGRWSASERRVKLEIGDKTYALAARLTVIDDGDARSEELVLSGDAPDPSLNATFRPAPARLP